MKHASTWLDSLMEISRGEREPFGSRWTFTGTHLERGVYQLVARYPEPSMWDGRAVDVYCEAVTEVRHYRLDVAEWNGSPAYSVSVEGLAGSERAKLAAQLAEKLFTGVIDFQPAAVNSPSIDLPKINMGIAR